MGSHAQDSTTQKASSTAAQQAAATQAANAQQAPTQATNQQNAQWGTYNPATNSFTGGSMSAFLDPTQLNNANLTGSYAQGFTQQNNQLAQDTSRGVGTTLQSLQNRGMGSSPAGFAADQIRKAYADAATTRGSNYAESLGAQHNEALNQFNTANSLLTNSANTNQASATANNSGAAGTNTSLYGTASQPVQTGWGTVLNTVGQLGGSAASGFGGALGASAAKRIGCWVAAIVLDGWDGPQTDTVRSYVFSPRRGRIGRSVAAFYLRHGERLAELMKAHSLVRWAVTPLVYVTLHLAVQEAR